MITHHHLVPLPARQDRGASPQMQLAFRVFGQPSYAPLATTYGPMGLYLGQVCEALPGEESGPVLVTVKYRYALYIEGDDEPVALWEFDGQPTDPQSRWCRHHLQGPMRLPLAGRNVPLDAFHLPTGPVPIEDVARFCIVDLGVAPLSDDWHEALLASARRSTVRFIE